MLLLVLGLLMVLLTLLVLVLLVLFAGVGVGVTGIVVGLFGVVSFGAGGVVAVGVVGV